MTISTPETLVNTMTRQYKYINEDRVGIKTSKPQYELDVLGTIRAKEVLVNLSGSADFVFDTNYELMPLSDLEKYIGEEKHLPEIPSTIYRKENNKN